MSLLLPPYSVGTASVANGGTTVSIPDAILTDMNARELDMFVDVATGISVFIRGVPSTTTLTIDAWPGSTLTDADYRIEKTSPLRYVGGKAMADVQRLVDYLNTLNIIISVAGDEPEAEAGEDGWYALKSNGGTGWKLWLKVDGAWVLQGTPVGLTYKGTWNSTTEYLANDRVSRNGTTYIAKQTNTGNDPATDTSATYWDTAGVKGDTGPAPTIKGTSTSIIAIGTGSKTFTTQAGVAWSVGQRLRVANADSSKALVGAITAYSGTTLTINVDDTVGTGSDSSWNISIAGEKGQIGRTATVAVGSVTTTPPGTDATITNVGTANDAVLNISLPKGEKGSTGDAATVAVNSTVTLPAGSDALVENLGSSGAASLKFSIPEGPQGIQGIQGEQGVGIEPDVTGTFADRSTYDGQDKGFRFLQTDVSPFLLWVKASNISADWAGPSPIGGTVAFGDLGHITDTIFQTFDYGHIAA